METINWHEYLTADFDAGTLTWKLRAREQFHVIDRGIHGTRALLAKSLVLFAREGIGG